MSIKKLSSVIPEGKIKEILQFLYLRYFSNRWYKLHRKIKETSEENNFIKIELKNGLVFYDRRSNVSPPGPALKYGKKSKMSKIKKPGQYQQIYRRLYQEFVENQHLKEFSPTKQETVVDAGANIGVFSVKAAKIVGDKGKIIAIEPEPGNIQILKKNIKANNLNNVLVVEKGLWDKSTTKKLHLSDFPGLHSLFSNLPGLADSSSSKSIGINLDTLDNIAAGKIDFIKMDIEGAEIKALRGAREVLSKMKPKLVIEAKHKVEGEPTYKKILPFLKKLGYTVAIGEDKTLYAK